MYKIGLASIVLILGLVFAGCSQQERSAPPQEATSSMKQKEAEASSAPSEQTVPDDIDTSRKLVKTGELVFETKNVDSSESYIQQLTESFNAYVQQKDKRSSADHIDYDIEVKVPSARFDAYLDAVTKHAYEVDRKQITTKDQTEQYIDIAARLKNKKELEEHYRQLLDEAEAIEDMLAIEEKLSKVREEIESVERRLRHLQQRVNHSTLRINFYQNTGASLQFFESLGNAFAKGWTVFLRLVLLISHLWMLFVLAGLIYLGFKLFRKKR
jgi:hypothetical protein